MPHYDAKVRTALNASAQRLAGASEMQERAVNRILGLVEVLYDRVRVNGDISRLDTITSSCAFQDLTGQRMNKVARLTRWLESLEGNANKAVQDAMLAGLRHLTACQAEQTAALTVIQTQARAIAENVDGRDTLLKLQAVIDATKFAPDALARMEQVRKLLLHIGQLERISADLLDQAMTPEPDVPAEEDKAPIGLSQAEVDRLLNG